MCAACVAQGAAYAGGAVAALQVMAARARHRRGVPGETVAVTGPAPGSDTGEPGRAAETAGTAPAELVGASSQHP
jgi:hypothetical protein